MLWSAVRSEYPQLLEVQKACILGLGETYSEDQLQRWVQYLDIEGSERYGRYRNLVHLDKGKVVGFCSWAMKFRSCEADIECLYVLPEFRSNRLGGTLLSEVESRLPSGTAVAVRSTLNAEGFYTAHGYRTTGDDVSRAGFAIRLMRKDFK